MNEQKINEVIVSTPAFMATLTYPIRNKTTTQVSKKNTVTQEELEVAIVISPVVHGATKKKDLNLADAFYNIIAQDKTSGFARNKAQNLEKFLGVCGDKVKNELMENTNLKGLRTLRKKLDNAIVHLLDKSGILIESKISTMDDIIFWLGHIQQRINEQVYDEANQERPPSLLITHAAPLAAKPRRHERVKKAGSNKKEGWHIKSSIYSAEKSHGKAA